MEKRYYKFAVLLAVAALLFSYGATRVFLRNGFYSFSAPLQSFLWRAGSSFTNTFVAVTHSASLQKEVRALRQENAALALEGVIAKELRQENDALRKAQDIAIAREYATIAADAIAKEINDDILVLNRGLGDGIKEGMPVITPSKILAGRVIEVGPGFSRVLLISSAHSSFDAKVAGRNMIGVVKGKGKFQAFLDLVPQGADIAKGDLVATSKLSGLFPDNLLVGAIQDIQATDVDPFRRAELSLSYSIGMASPLLIITSYAP